MTNYASVISIFFSVGQALISTIFSCLLALPLAYLFSIYTFNGKIGFISLCTLLTIMPTKFVALCITSFGMCGFWGIVFSHVLLNIPFAFASFYLVLQKYDTTLYAAASDAGASPYEYLKDIMWPVVRPALLTSILLIFIICFASISIPLMVGTGPHHFTIDLIVQQAYSAGDYATVVSYSVLRLLIFIPLVWLLGQVGNVLPHQIIVQIQAPTKYNPSVHGWEFFTYGLLLGVAVLAPLLYFIYRSIDIALFNFWYAVAWGGIDQQLRLSVAKVIYNSFLLACVSSWSAVVAGLLICYGEQLITTRYKRWAYTLLINLPFLLGGVLSAIVFSAGAAWTGMPRFTLAVMCHLFLNYPFTYCIIKAQHALLLPEWRLTARSLGATGWQILRTIDIPFLRSALRNAWLIAFGLSLTEVGAGSIVGDAAGMTMPMAIRIYRAQGLDTQAIGLSFILLIIVLMVGLVTHKRADSNKK